MERMAAALGQFWLCGCGAAPSHRRGDVIREILRVFLLIKGGLTLGQAPAADSQLLLWCLFNEEQNYLPDWRAVRWALPALAGQELSLG